MGTFHHRIISSGTAIDCKFWGPTHDVSETDIDTQLASWSSVSADIGYSFLES